MLGAKIFIDFGKISFEECIKKLNQQIAFIKEDHHNMKLPQIKTEVQKVEEKQDHKKAAKPHADEASKKLNEEHNEDAKTVSKHKESKDKMINVDIEEPKFHSDGQSQPEENKPEVHVASINEQKTETLLVTIVKNLGIKQLVSEWTETDVENWFHEKKILYSIKQNISPCDGNVLGQLYKMSIDVPEFFYSCLRNDTKANLKDLAFFANQLRLIHEKKN